MRTRLDIPLKLSEIAEVLSAGEKQLLTDKEIMYISTDTRELSEGDLFIALKGRRYDGEEFATAASEMGAVTVAMQNIPGGICVKDTEEALFKIAQLYKTKLKRLKSTVAITGSVGKTTTKDFLRIILQKRFTVSSTPGNFNNSVGSCLSVLSAKADTEILILEMGMNHTGEIARLSNAFRPDIGIITNIGSSHIGNLGSREAIANAKLEILEGMEDKLLIIPKGEPLLEKSGRYSFSTEDEGADFYLHNVYGTLSFYNRERWIFNSEFQLGERHLLNCIAPAAATALLLGVPVSLISEAINGIGRESIKQRFLKIGDFTVYEDLYNASPESLVAAFKFVTGIYGYGKRSALIGSVRELGEISGEIHRDIGRSAAESGFHTLYLFGEFAREMKEGAISAGFSKDRIFLFTDSMAHKSAADAILEKAEKDELILIKGSRAMELEKVAEIMVKELRKRDADA